MSILQFFASAVAHKNARNTATLEFRREFALRQANATNEKQRHCRIRSVRLKKLRYYANEDRHAWEA